MGGANCPQQKTVIVLRRKRVEWQWWWYLSFSRHCSLDLGEKQISVCDSLNIRRNRDSLDKSGWVAVLSVGTAAGSENSLFRSFCRFVPFENTQNEVQMWYCSALLWAEGAMFCTSSEQWQHIVTVLEVNNSENLCFLTNLSLKFRRFILLHK